MCGWEVKRGKEKKKRNQKFFDHRGGSPSKFVGAIVGGIG